MAFKNQLPFGDLLNMSISAEFKIGLEFAVNLLNNSAVKEGIKIVSGVVTFTFGLAEAYDLYLEFSDRQISTEKTTRKRTWIDIAKKISQVMAKWSLILSASVSSVGVFLISSLVGRIFLPSQLEQWFGPNTTYAINPLHPRHVVSNLAIILAIPSLLQSCYEGAKWVGRKIRLLSQEPPRPFEGWLTESKRRMMILFNTITSRPVLHFGNQLCHKLIKA
jgi:hypothetical protein